MTPKKSANIAVEKLLRNNRLEPLDFAGLKIDILRFSWVGTNFLVFEPRKAKQAQLRRWRGYDRPRSRKAAPAFESASQIVPRAGTSCPPCRSGVEGQDQFRIIARPLSARVRPIVIHAPWLGVVHSGMCNTF